MTIARGSAERFNYVELPPAATIIPHITRYLETRVFRTAFLLGGGEIRSAFGERIIIMRSLISRRERESFSGPSLSLSLSLWFLLVRRILASERYLRIRKFRTRPR